MGVVGLGTGTIAAYGREGDVIRFYEINPAICVLAHDYFTYLGSSAAKVDVVLGDARLSMEQELQNGSPQRYDLLVVDAFNSDAIPIHLLTKECVDVYWRHLAPDGVLALHISNRFLDLARHTHLSETRPGTHGLQVDSPSDTEGATRARWMLLTTSSGCLQAARQYGVANITIDDAQRTSTERAILWTDDFHSLWSVFRWE